MRSAVVYEILNKVDAKAYIGVAVDLRKRLSVHMYHVRNGTGFKVHAAIRKHGAAAFLVRVRASLPSREEAYLAERLLIASEQPAYNLTAGGDGVRGNAETCAKIAAKSRGRKQSDETRAKLRAASKAQVNRSCGPFDASHRDKIRKANTGKVQSAETRAKRSVALKRAYAEGRMYSHFKSGERSADGRVMPKKAKG